MPNIGMGIGVSYSGRKGLGTWYPTRLYSASSGDILPWYDPSDLSTMFTDVAGTTNVTAHGQAVALMLDKGQWGGKTLAQVLAAATELLTNTGFDSDTVWVKGVVGSPTAATISAGVVNLPRTNSTNYAFVSQSFATVIGASYQITVTSVSGSYAARAGTAANATQSLNALGVTGATTTFVFTATATTTHVTLIPGTDGVTSVIDAASTKLIPGYPRTQATAANMPLYQTGPNPAAAENSPELVTNGTFDVNTSGWTAAGVTIAHLAGRIELTQTSTNGSAYQAIPTVIGRGYKVVSAVFDTTNAQITKSDTTSPFGTNWLNVNAGGAVLVNRDITTTFVATATTTYIHLVVGGVAIADPKEFDNVSVKEIPASAPYIHWLLYDGINDGHVTPSIDWGTDEVFICTGVTKTQAAAVGFIAEFSPAVGTNNGSWALYDRNAATYGFQSAGTAASGIAFPIGVYAPPVTNVLTGLAKISTDVATIRVDGADEVTVSGDQGTGNFGNYPLYFGRRGGSSLPFSGREHQTFLRSRLPSAAELAKSEAFVAAKTGVIIRLPVPMDLEGDEEGDQLIFEDGETFLLEGAYL